jgi:hypothetical protein
MIFHNDERPLKGVGIHEGVEKGAHEVREVPADIDVPDAKGVDLEIGDEVILRGKILDVIRASAHLKEPEKDTFRLSIQAGDIHYVIDSRLVERA